MHIINHPKPLNSTPANCLQHVLKLCKKKKKCCRKRKEKEFQLGRFSSPKAHAVIIFNQFNSQMGRVTCSPGKTILAGANLNKWERQWQSNYFHYPVSSFRFLHIPEILEGLWIWVKTLKSVEDGRKQAFIHSSNILNLWILCKNRNCIAFFFLKKNLTSVNLITFMCACVSAAVAPLFHARVILLCCVREGKRPHSLPTWSQSISLSLFLIVVSELP